MASDDKTEIVCILDRSGSMSAIRDDAIGAFNTFLLDNQNLPGEALLTVVKFNHLIETLYDGVPIAEAKPLTSETYVPDGTTALLDAVGRTLTMVKDRHEADPAGKPAKTLVVILTDGHENSSQVFTRQDVFEMVKYCQATFAWEFIFLAANIDEFDAGMALGITQDKIAGFDGSSHGVQEAYKSVTNACMDFRVSGKIEKDWGEEAKRTKLKKAGKATGNVSVPAPQPQPQPQKKVDETKRWWGRGEKAQKKNKWWGPV